MTIIIIVILGTYRWLAFHSEMVLVSSVVVHSLTSLSALRLWILHPTSTLGTSIINHPRLEQRADCARCMWLVIFHRCCYLPFVAFTSYIHSIHMLLSCVFGRIVVTKYHHQPSWMIINPPLSADFAFDLSRKMGEDSSSTVFWCHLPVLPSSSHPWYD
jgi:hypothetical protein